MITVYEYACLSGHVYQPHTGGYGSLIITETDFNKLTSDASGFYMMTDVDPFVVPHNGFYAALYLKFWEGELEDAVIAFRGTVPDYLSNDLVDLLSWFSSAMGTGEADRVPFFFKEASVFVEKAYDYLDDNFPNFPRLSWHLSYTGHSLGGALAQMMTLRKRYPHQSVVFNSPGCTEMAGPAYEERRHKVLSINARWGIINKIGLPVGPMIPIDIPEEEGKAKALVTGFGEGFYHFSLQLDHTSDNVRYLSPPLASILHQFGYAARIGAYDESLANLAQESSVKKQLEACREEHEGPAWYTYLLSSTYAISKLMAEKSEAAFCEAKTLAVATGETIAAQHSIKNMVKALNDEENVRVAKKLVI